MRYRLPDGTTLEVCGRPSALHLDLDRQGRCQLTDGGWLAPRVFQHKDATGKVIAMYGRSPTTSALDDYLYITDLYYVHDGALYRGGIEAGGAGRVYRVRQMHGDVVLTGLVAIP
jgi:esterase/lipase superfamily enzyme